MTEQRARVWAGIIYPDSMPNDWLKTLHDLHVPLAVSPLHASDDDEKKPHYHVLFHFDGKKTIDQVSAIMKKLNGTVPIRVASVSGYARYLCHIDDPDKEQYSPLDVVTMSGFDYAMYLVPSGTEKRKILREIDEYIFSHHVREVCDLVGYALENEPDWYAVLQAPAVVSRCRNLIFSLRYSTH